MALAALNAACVLIEPFLIKIIADVILRIIVLEVSALSESSYCVSIDGLACNRSGGAKVADFDLALTVDEEICGLQVSVHEARRVQELGGAE